MKNLFWVFIFSSEFKIYNLKHENVIPNENEYI